MKADLRAALDRGRADACSALDNGLQHACRDRPRKEADTDTCSAFEHAMTRSNDWNTGKNKNRDKDAKQTDRADCRDLCLLDLTAAQPLMAQRPLSDPAGESRHASGSHTDVSRRELVARLTQALDRGVDRLFVLDSQGTGLRAVRMTLDADLLPGATVQVAEVAGCMQATFNCAQQRSRQRLSAGLDALARQWARSLKRPVRVLLGGQDPDIFDEQAVQADPEQAP